MTETPLRYGSFRAMKGAISRDESSPFARRKKPFRNSLIIKTLRTVYRSVRTHFSFRLLIAFIAKVSVIAVVLPNRHDEVAG